MKDKPIYPDPKLADEGARLYAHSNQLRLNEGMTLLEHYAGQLMQALAPIYYGGMKGDVQECAKWSVILAKALIRELENN